MRALLVLFVLSASAALPARGFAQAADNPDLTTIYCDFEDGKEVSAQYLATAKEEPHAGKVWVPGGQAITLFAQTPLVVGGKDVPAAAYTVYLLPGRKDWTLIISKNTSLTAPYDEKNDLVRASMDLGEVNDVVKIPQLSLAHTSAKTCNLRVYIGKVGAFVDMNQK